MSNAAIITRRRNTRQQIENVLMNIEHRICQGHTDKEIMEELGIKERTFYYYKEKIYQLSTEVQSKKNTDGSSYSICGARHLDYYYLSSIFCIDRSSISGSAIVVKLFVQLLRTLFAFCPQDYHYY